MIVFPLTFVRLLQSAGPLSFNSIYTNPVVSSLEERFFFFAVHSFFLLQDYVYMQIPLSVRVLTSKFYK